MSDTVEQALLSAIFAAPDDDGPRLVYADWLSERGDPRGEFIALQCQLETIDRSDPRWNEIQARADEIRQRYNGKWARHVARYIARSEWRRGFLWRIRAFAPSFVAGARKILELAPAPDVTLVEVIKCIDLVAAAPIGKCSRLEVSSQELTPAQVARIIESPTIRGLRGLALFGQPLGPSGAEVVASAPHLASLENLDLGSCALLDAGVAVIARSETLAGLRRLRLGNNGITWQGAEALASARWPALAELDLALNRIGDAGITAIASSTGFPALERLQLHRSDLTEAGLESLLATKLPLRAVAFATGDIPRAMMDRMQARFEVL